MVSKTPNSQHPKNFFPPKTHTQTETNHAQQLEQADKLKGRLAVPLHLKEQTHKKEAKVQIQVLLTPR